MVKSPLKHVNDILAKDDLALSPVIVKNNDGTQHIVNYELREPGPAGRRHIGVISKTFLSALARMRPEKMATALDTKQRA